MSAGLSDCGICVSGRRSLAFPDAVHSKVHALLRAVQKSPFPSCPRGGRHRALRVRFAPMEPACRPDQFRQGPRIG